MPVQNGWHPGTIEKTDSGLRWINAAGRSWALTPDYATGNLLTGPDCPYYNSPGGRAFTLEWQGSTLVGFRFQGELYARNGLGSRNPDVALGHFQRLPVQNGWHPGTIEQTDSGLRWINAAGRSWALTPDYATGNLLTGPDCPYYNSPGGRAFTPEWQGSALIGFRFQGELYSKSGMGAR
jgi:hypothetical protein